MNAQKIMNEYGDGNEQIDFPCPERKAKLPADLLHRKRRLIRRERSEQGTCLSVCVRRVDVVLNVFEFSADGLCRMRVQDLMELQDVVGRKGNVFIIFMNDAQGIPIAGDLLLVARTRCGLIRQQLFQARIGRAYPFDGIGCFRALHFSDLDKLFKLLRRVFQIEFLLALCLMNGGDIGDGLRIPFLIFQGNIVECAHLFLLKKTFLVNYSLFYEKSQYNLQENIMKRKSIFIFVYMYFSIECPSNTIILSSSIASSRALCVSL